MIYLIISGQSNIPQGVVTRCYNTGDCNGAVNEQFSQLFDSSQDNINHCCYDGNDILSPRSTPEMLSFTLNGGGCRSCDGKAIYERTATTIMLFYSYVYHKHS